jgi:hypothetical protein|tara:strand:- start:201 stop:431 length:231 start_codon:yes stop_codon:yes gene_type:complete
MGGKPRNYKREYTKFHSSKEAIAERSNRNKARRKMIKLGRVRKGDKRDVHHANRRPLDNSSGNLKVMTRSRNRALK